MIGVTSVSWVGKQQIILYFILMLAKSCGLYFSLIWSFGWLLACWKICYGKDCSSVIWSPLPLHKNVVYLDGVKCLELWWMCSFYCRIEAFDFKGLCMIGWLLLRSSLFLICWSLLTSYILEVRYTWCVLQLRPFILHIFNTLFYLYIKVCLFGYSFCHFCIMF